MRTILMIGTLMLLVACGGSADSTSKGESPKESQFLTYNCGEIDGCKLECNQLYPITKFQLPEYQDQMQQSRNKCYGESVIVDSNKKQRCGSDDSCASVCVALHPLCGSGVAGPSCITLQDNRNRCLNKAEYLVTGG